MSIQVSSLLLNVEMVAADTTSSHSSGNLFQWSTILWLKECLLNSSLELLLYSLRLCPLNSVVFAFWNNFLLVRSAEKWACMQTAFMNTVFSFTTAVCLFHFIRVIIYSMVKLWSHYSQLLVIWPNILVYLTRFWVYKTEIMVCVPCIVIPVLLWIFHKYIQPLILKFWNPWASKSVSPPPDSGGDAALDTVSSY